ncbi:hypothetical protein TrRE_jg8520 [Triparma retinervis]|uniref:EF-hand domain-containing protein n=1 Tax=Triparma retinervis TaxID=2557542 RepID=A0A9W7E9Z3_9STRA|nr:hypothetical protein TrRE_jg8520 [Triparma retinervis]
MLSNFANNALRRASGARGMASTTRWATKTSAPSMVYIAGEEMTNYACELITKDWIEPYFTTEKWEHFDMSCTNRDDTDDKVLHDAVAAGSRIGAIFKEPTITPTAEQKEEFGLKNALGSPNGAMRRGWNGITISRDTIHIDGVELGFKKPLLTTFHPLKGDPILVDSRDLEDDHNVVVVYHNPLDNVEDLAHHFFSRCLEAEVVPYVVTKKTVFKWQEGFWAIHKKVFDENYKEAFAAKGLLDNTGGELQHLISDAATMQIIRWTGGNFGMSAHNYDGDMLTDEVAQVHRSPGFITSNLIGKRDDGAMIKEYEASHGTVSDLWHAHLRGEETSLNPLGLVEAMIGSMQHAAKLELDADPSTQENYDRVMTWTVTLRKAMHNTFRYGQGTRDMSGPDGYTTEDFIKKVAWRLDRYLVQQEDEDAPVLGEPSRAFRRNHTVDEDAVQEMFNQYDTDGNGAIDLKEFTEFMVKMGVAPMKDAKNKEGKESDV